jgi:hypothetical protein
MSETQQERIAILEAVCKLTTGRAEAAEAECERLNRHLVQIHAALAEHAETETEVWVMREIEKALNGDPA